MPPITSRDHLSSPGAVTVSFWFDPACPFCWMTSRWLVEVAPQRDLQVDWRSISLLLKNDPPPDSPYHATTVRTHGYLRVVESLRAAGLADRVGALYTRLGIAVHHDQDAADLDVAAVLAELGVDPAHASAVDDDRFDLEIKASMDEGLALTGDDVGTPLIALDGPDGRRVGLFGPVITEQPSPDGALRLWDGFVAMVTTAGFSELKRSRPGPPALPDLDRVP